MQPAIMQEQCLAIELELKTPIVVVVPHEGEILPQFARKNNTDPDDVIVCPRKPSGF
jgi:hypothetical protein